MKTAVLVIAMYSLTLAFSASKAPTGYAPWSNGIGGFTVVGPEMVGPKEHCMIEGRYGICTGSFYNISSATYTNGTVDPTYLKVTTYCASGMELNSIDFSDPNAPSSYYVGLNMWCSSPNAWSHHDGVVNGVMYHTESSD